MAGLTQVMARPERPLLIFDGDCTFCRYWVHRWHRAAREQFDFLPFQAKEVSDRFPEISQAACEREVHFVEPNGRVSRGAEAVFRSLSSGGGYRWLLRGYERMPTAAVASERAYHWVATHRGFFSWLTRVGWGAQTAPPTFVAVRWLFLRGMSLCYLAAFLSLWVQIDGLVGSNGILPVADQLSGIRAEATLQAAGRSLYWQEPTLCWLSSGDALLTGQCGAGIVLSLVALAGVLTGPCLLLLWLLYLSLTTACGIFLGYQWDALLLESGLLACWMAPWRVWEGWKRAPSRLGRWLLLWLVFRLMFTSGCIKLATQDPTWRGLTALQYHYQTQPLPTWVGWYAHQLGPGLHKASTLLMFGVELVVPFLILGPRRLRLVAFWAFTAFMILIGLTGNYGFFNLLTFVLCLWLLDDQFLLRWIPSRWRSHWVALAAAAAGRFRPVSPWEILRRVALVALAAIIALITVAQTTALFGPPRPRVAVWVARWVGPLRSVNRYGLFARMTTRRPEIVVEGSRDGVRWEAYAFKDKPGGVRRAPPFLGLHMPRLDWQMWFAALGGDYRRSPWFIRFSWRLLEGSPPVLKLLEKNPFPEQPPKYVRARLFEYQFTDLETRRRTGAWWQRRLIGEFGPVMSLPGKSDPPR